MREIKFRAWNGSYYEYGGFSIHATGKIITDAKELTKVDGNSIIEQYTGLKDKNGVEIYEGDIIKVYDKFEKKHVNIYVVFEDGCFSTRYCNEKDYHYKNDSVFDNGLLINILDYFTFTKKGIIIGKIHQNPELLEDK